MEPDHGEIRNGKKAFSILQPVSDFFTRSRGKVTIVYSIV
jgi:hypothetical protein